MMAGGLLSISWSRWCTYAAAIIVVFSASAAAKSPYAAVLIPYEDGIITDGGELMAAQAALTLSTFHALAPPYGRLLFALSRGLPLGWQVEELYPGHTLNALLKRELHAGSVAVLQDARVAPHLPRLLRVAAARGIRLLVYTTLDPDWVAGQLAERKIDLPLIETPPIQAQPAVFPPVERVRAELEITPSRLLLIGSSKHACVTAGIHGMDFVSLGALPEAPVVDDPPCRVLRRLRSLDELSQMLSKSR